MVNCCCYCYFLSSLVVQMIKDPPAMWETWARSWVGKIPWRRERLPTPVFLPGESSWTEEPGGLQSMGLQTVGHNWVTKYTCGVIFITTLCQALCLILAKNNPCPQGAQSHRTDINNVKQSLCGLCTYEILWKEAPRREQGQPLWGAHSWSVSKRRLFQPHCLIQLCRPLKCEHFTHTCLRSAFWSIFFLLWIAIIFTPPRFYIFRRSYIYPMLLSPIQSSPTKSNTTQPNSTQPNPYNQSLFFEIC